MRGAGGWFETKVCDPQRGCFAGSAARIVEKEKEDPIAASDGRSRVWCTPKRLHLRLVEIGQNVVIRLLFRNRTDLCSPTHMLGAVTLDKPCQRVDSTESLISRSSRASAFPFQMTEEALDKLDRDISDSNGTGWFPNLHREVLQQQKNGVAIAALRVYRKVPFADDVFKKKPAHPGSDQRFSFHGAPPERRNIRSVCMPLPIIPGSRLDTAGWTL